MAKLEENALAVLEMTLKRTVWIRIFILYIMPVWDKLVLFSQLPVSHEMEMTTVSSELLFDQHRRKFQRGTRPKTPPTCNNNA